MILELSYYSVTLFATTLILTILAVYVWHKRSVPGGTYFALLMAAAAEWAFMGALEYGTVDVSTEILFARLTYVGALAIPALWIRFALDYCELGHWMTRRWNALLWVLPAIAIALIFTNDYHGLIWSSIETVHTELGATLIYHKGIAFWIIIVYIFTLMVSGMLLLVRKALRGRENNKYLTAIVLLGSLIIGLSGIISEVYQYSLRGVDITPFAYAIVGLIVVWGIYRHNIFELLPMATEKLTESMADGVLVLNPHGEIVKINVAARQMFGTDEAAIGQQAEKALARWPLLTRCLRDSGGSTCEFTTAGGYEGHRWIDASVSRLQDNSARPLGTLVILRDVTERKLSEESLRKSEHDLLKAEQLANIGYFELDLESQKAYVSEGCATIFGFPPGTSTVPYQQFIEKIHPDDFPRLGKAVSSLIEQGKAQSIEYRILLSDGSVRHIHSEAEMAADSPDASIGLFGIVHDVTEHRLYEESLRKSEHDRLKAEQLGHIGYYDWDLKTLEAQISEGCSRIFGFPEGTDRITYGMLTEKFHPEDAERVKRVIREDVWQGRGTSVEYRIVLPDGTVRHIICESEVPVKDATGAYTRQFGIVQDITERRRAEEIVRLTEQRYKTIVETANESICIVNNEAKLAFVNNKAAKMLGYTPEDMLGHSVFEFIDREDHELLRKNLVAKRLDSREQSNYRMRCKNGSLIWALSSSSPLYDDKGEIVGLLAMLTDITAIKQADERLKASLKEKEALLKEVHHRVKNNLQIVTSLLHLQSSGIEDPKYISMIRDSQNRIKSMALVHEHLYKSGDLSNIDIAEYLDSLVSNLARSYGHPSGNVAFRTDLENINMDIDKAVPIGIIVTELVSNSIKYAFPGGRKGEIRVELRRDDKKNVLTISDNGVGLPAGFEIGKTNTLGLQLVEMLAQQIDGTLEIDRTERTIFRITIVG